MDNSSTGGGVELVGEPCTRHGPYTFYRAFRFGGGGGRIVGIGDFFFCRVWEGVPEVLSIGQLQLLWHDKHQQQPLASLRLYFLPENTPDGRNEEHGEDEVVASSEKVVLRVSDLVQWMAVGGVEWRWGHRSAAPLDDATAEPVAAPAHVVVLSFPRYCRYRSVQKRLEGEQAAAEKHASLGVALGGLADPKPRTAVLFCRDNFDCPELEAHELLCNHLAPKFAGRPRKKKWRTSSPGSDSNESDGSSYSVESIGKVKRLGLKQSGRLGVKRGAIGAGAVGTPGRRCKQEVDFLAGLYEHMAQTKQPIEKVPSLGFKQLDLWAFYKKVRQLGGYHAVTRQRQWKRVYDELGGAQSNTSAATCTRKHYERLLLAYEVQLQTPKKRGRKPKVRLLDHLPPTHHEMMAAAQPAAAVERPRPPTDDSPDVKKRKLEILAKGGLDIRPVATAAAVPVAAPAPAAPPTVATAPGGSGGRSEVSITVTPDLSHMLERRPAAHGHMFARTGRVYGNPRLPLPPPPGRPLDKVLDLTIKPVPQLASHHPQQRRHLPDVSILPQNGHHPPPQPKQAKRSGSSLEITLVPANGGRGPPGSAPPPPGPSGAAEAAAALYYNAALTQMLQQQDPMGLLNSSELYKSLLTHQASLPLLACLNRAFPHHPGSGAGPPLGPPSLPRDGSTSITPLPKKH